MANYSLVVNSKFNPYSVEHYLQPYKEYERVYKELEDDLTTLDESDDWAAQIATDATYGTKYTEYKKKMDDLNSKLQYGANLRELKSAFSTARSSYRNDIAPIKTRVENRAKYADEQRALKRANPNLYMDVDYSSMNLDDERLDKPASYKTIDGNDVYKHASLSGISLGKELRNPNEKYQTTKDNMFVERQLQYGFTEDELVAAINGNGSNSTLNDTISKLRSRYDYDNATQEEQDFIDNNIYLGLKDNARATYQTDVRNNSGYTRPKTEAEKEFEELQLKTARMQYKQSLILKDTKTGLPIGKWNEDKGDYDLLDTSHIDTRTEEQKIIDSAPYSMTVGVLGDKVAHSTENMAINGKADNSDGTARRWLTDNETVEGGEFSLPRINEALGDSGNGGQVITTLDVIHDAFKANNSKIPNTVAALQAKGINIAPALLQEMMDITYRTYDDSKKSGNVTVRNLLGGRTAGSIYVIAVNQQSGKPDRGDLGNVDYVLINEAAAGNYSNIADKIGSYQYNHTKSITSEGL